MNPRTNPFKRTFQEPPTQGGFRMVAANKNSRGSLSNTPEKDRSDRVATLFLYLIGAIGLFFLTGLLISLFFT